MDEIVICHRCDGYGQVHHDVGGHKSEYEYSVCCVCKGSGRLEQTTSVKHKPFTPGDNKSKRIF